MARKWVNNGFSTLAGALNTTDTTLSVASSHGDRFPTASGADFFYLTLQDASSNTEVVKVTARTGGSDSMTIVRAQESSTARSWAIGDIVELRLTAEALTEFTEGLGYLDGVTAGTVTASKAVIYGASGEVAATTLNTTTLQIGGSSVTATAAELNKLDGVTASTSELNVLDGVTATTGELNILDGVTSSAAELNLLDGAVANTVVNSKAVVYGSSGQVQATTVDLGNWTVTESSGVLYFATGGVNKMKLDSSGNLTVTGNVTAYGSV